MTQHPSIDRSKEFLLIIQRYKTKSQFIPSNNFFKPKPTKPHDNINTESFKNVAKYLSNMLQQTDSKLTQLEIFVDPKIPDQTRDRSQIDNLTQIIATDLSDLTKLFTKMQELLKATNSKLPFSVQKRAHLNSIALHIQNRFQHLSGRFKDCVKIKESFSGNRLAKERRIYDGYEDDRAGVREECGPNVRQEADNRLSIVVTDVAELRQRERSVRDVEATIVQLGDVFQQFQSVVQEQDELVQGILCRASSSLLDIEDAHNQMTKYFHAIKSHRSLMLRVFAVLVFVIVTITYLL